MESTRFALYLGGYIYQIYYLKIIFELISECLSYSVAVIATFCFEVLLLTIWSPLIKIIFYFED